MPKRSQSVTCTPHRNRRTGSLSYRVMGTVNKKQEKRYFADYDEAMATRDAWELERVRGVAASRPKLTKLTYAQLGEAEVIYQMLEGSGASPRDAVLHFLRNPPVKRVEILFAAALQEFFTDKEGHVSDRQFANHKSALFRLSAHVGSEQPLADVRAEQITGWLKSLECGKKSWNNYRSSIGTFFNWAKREPRNWIQKSPLEGVVAYRISETLSDDLPERLSVQKCSELMAYLEAEKPLWVLMFATALFLGVRPDGEMKKLGRAIARDGLNRYLRDDTLYLTAKITKDRRARSARIPDNLKTWWLPYPLTPEVLQYTNRDEYAKIRARFNIPFDGLRHTSISACVALHGISYAAFCHGTSERVIRAHYLNLMSKDEALEFYSILPSKPAGSIEDFPKNISA